MKFSIVRSKFLSALQTVQNVVTTKGTLQILQNVLLKAEDNLLSLTTTDMDISEKCNVECEIQVPGQTSLPIKRLVSVLPLLNDEKVEIEVDENDMAHLRCGSADFKLIGLSVRDFPPVPVPEGNFSYKVDQGAFREMLKKTSYATSQDETRRALTGVLLAFRDSKLTMVATDGRRLALVEKEIEFPAEAEREIILPRKTVNELVHLLQNEGDLKIYAKEGLAIFDLGNVILTSKLIDSVYPNYRQVIPTGCDERVVIDRESFLSAIRRVSAVTTDKSNSITFTFGSNQLIISTNSKDVGEGRDTLPVKYAGKEISIIFNPEYVMEPLKTIEEDEVYLELSDGHSPALLKCGIPFLYVLMPLRV
ncbi:MAG: DNA polymerase III subunit beta [Kiritimatiellae bacterium]|nr:DNA polymerase III subunit beta [Kiritimatiellia bacterium]